MELVNDVQDVMTIKAMAIRRGVSLAYETSFRNVIIEGDLLQVINALPKCSEDLSPWGV